MNESQLENERHDVYSIVTQQIIDLLERGTVPWHKPWATGDTLPAKLVSKKAYRGINVFMLAMANYSSPYWLTYKQAKELGGQVRKGETSTLVVFWKIDKKTDEQTKEEKVYRILRYYRVFNVEQCDGIDYPRPEPKLPNFNPIEAAENLAAGMPNPPTLEHKIGAAFYRRDADLVNMPGRETFEREADYYSTLFHELAHATGHDKRLGRLQDSTSGFGSTSYAKEELVAEMTASFLSSLSGILDRTVDNSASYIAAWLEKLRNDRKLVVHAAAAAQKASDYIRGISYGKE